MSNSDVKSSKAPLLLLNVKNQLDEAQKLVKIGDNFSCLRSVILGDLAVEQLLNLIILDWSQEGLTGKKKQSWGVFAQNRHYSGRRNFKFQNS